MRFTSKEFKICVQQCGHSSCFSQTQSTQVWRCAVSDFCMAGDVALVYIRYNTVATPPWFISFHDDSFYLCIFVCVLLLNNRIFLHWVVFFKCFAYTKYKIRFMHQLNDFQSLAALYWVYIRNFVLHRRYNLH